ncbi:MAG: isocitrate lyase/phosphoenolpyruvate mutase family protein [Chloracidobacterium sp.]|nr:isocitrate lyase/phosphoenolpyruvate mutase family protein [Chloracidobacterium sp.]MCC6825501.1 isocitrate lyase/phosphoenolpyruvate mutase family protein [Acidobacteriota bacterium]MCO5333467.1 isocitrate lyase/phosphoenolpyruvate mutase family protein [Pyrinomonadaceae bacterium]
MKELSDKERQNELAKRFHALHHTGEMLILANAWDCLSAKMIEHCGFPAVATTSSGMSWTLGYKDGEHIPPQLMVEAVGRIAQSVSVPVTADIEGGYYRDDLDKFSQFISSVIDAGVIGINIEDGHAHSERLDDIESQAKEIAAAKEVGERKGIDLFVNARTDAMLLPLEPNAKIEACIERAKAFQKAGADCIFIPFIRDMDTIAGLKSGIELPLNILMTNTLDVEALRSLKVERVSVGARPAMAAMHLLKEIAADLRSTSDWHKLFINDPSYEELNEWFI